jgi:hypothetical protein
MIVRPRGVSRDPRASTPMAEQSERIYWEQTSPQMWISAIGYITEAEGVWTAFVYHNCRTGKQWTQSQTGFLTAVRAKRWVEDNAEK